MALLCKDLIRYSLVRKNVIHQINSLLFQKLTLYVQPNTFSFQYFKYRVIQKTASLVIEVINSIYRTGSEANYRQKVSIK